MGVELTKQEAGKKDLWIFFEDWRDICIRRRKGKSRLYSNQQGISKATKATEATAKHYPERLQLPLRKRQKCHRSTATRST
jgi:hypothetical protein